MRLCISVKIDGAGFIQEEEEELELSWSAWYLLAAAILNEDKITWYGKNMSKRSHHGLGLGQSNLWI